MTKSSKKIAIIIVGYNSHKYLKDCLSSIKKSVFKNYFIIFVDNHSQDESVEFIRKNFPKIRIIQNSKNLGFAQGNNIGTKEAIRQKADFVFLLNPDTILDSQCLQKLIEKADNQTILQPQVLLYHKGKKTNMINTAGNALNYLGFSYCGDYKKQARQFKKDKEISLASGSALFIPIPIIEKIDLFERNFFMYHEDVDFCWRARLANFGIKLIPKAVVWHKYVFLKNKMKMFYSERNRLLFIFKNFSLKTILLFLLMGIINEVLVCVYALWNGWLMEKLSSYYSIFLLLDDLLKWRARIDRIRKKTDGEMKQYLNSKIIFEEVELPANKIYNSLLNTYWKIIKRFI